MLPEEPDARTEPWNTSPTAFQIVSVILLKLLAKNPEDRYQTIAALEADLRHCLTVLQEEPHRKGIPAQAFVPGQIDRSVHLDIPQVVVGRELETDVLVKSFQKTVNGSRASGPHHRRSRDW